MAAKTMLYGVFRDKVAIEMKSFERNARRFSFLAALAIVAMGTASSRVSVAKNREPVGHAFVYLVSLQSDFGDRAKLSDGVETVLKARIKAVLSSGYPRENVHVYTSDDFQNGVIKKDIDALARAGNTQPLDFFIISHSVRNSDNTAWGMLTKKGDVRLKDFFEGLIPQSQRAHLRLYMNAGCFTRSTVEALRSIGFTAAVTANAVSFGPLFMNTFGKEWVKERKASLALARVNQACLRNLSWKATREYFARFGDPSLGDSDQSKKLYDMSQEEFCKQNAYSINLLNSAGLDPTITDSLF